ncbi:hypothetical protein NQ176_g10512 [Zarea fungicola]|uniref:Uncharacterized protein n=1 Tax=Zarea fungicola TaxID=93591 RepID=A0ACC1MHD7_9HYPO|nr:hypothetical protein NQ176_g10512 [Lecanicillium fungicola]
MSESSLQDRLRDHAKAFNGLLSLIPAKQYYGEDTSDQWKKKKQTKKEAAAARRGKLDPDSELNRNAKEVMDERAQNKRKLRQEEQEESEVEEDEDENDDDEDSFVPINGVVAEEPGQGLRKAAEKPNKKQKFDPEPEQDGGESGVEVDDEGVPMVEETKLSKKEQKRAAKREREAKEKTTVAEKAEEEQPTPKAKSAKEQTEDTPKKLKSKSKKELKAAAVAAALDEDEAMPDANEASGFAAGLDVSGIDGKDDSEARHHICLLHHPPVRET